MKATPFSKEFYYPMSMSSGRDAVLIDYGGSNFLSLNDHTHFEPHQCAPFGWYKCANIKKGEVLQPIFMAGVQVVVHGAPAEPVFFDQEFISEDATLITDVKFRHGIVLRITSFLTYNDSIWCEKLEVLEAPADLKAKIGFKLCSPIFGANLGAFPKKAGAKFTQSSDKSFDFTYESGDYTGKGALISSLPFDTVKISGAELEATMFSCGQSYAEGLYNLSSGFSVSRALIALGDNESHIKYEDLLSRASMGFDSIYKKHKDDWNNYFSTAEISLPDDKLNDIYKISRYLTKAHLHPDTGLESLGMQPNHWKGAISCSWDAEFSHEAMLANGNFKETEHFTDAYLRIAPECYDALAKRGLPGLSYSGWTTLSGKFFGHCELDEWLANFKPMFSAYSIHAIYKEWRTNPKIDIEKYKQIATDVLRFWLARLIKKGEDGLYYLIEIKDGCETGVDSEVDTFTQIDFGKAFQYVGEMYGITEYKEIGDKMLLAVECNRRPNGILAAAKGSPNNGNIHMNNYYYTSEDNLVSPDVLHEAIESSRTPWGLDNDLAAEEYRHWPWNDMWSARAYVLMRNPDCAMEHIKHMSYGCSSLGALPEKLRLDGFGIGYWYTSPHGLFVTSITDGFAASAKIGSILLGYGYTPDFGDISCRGIRVAGGFGVSMNIKEGSLIYLEIRNDNEDERTLTLDINPQFIFPKELENVKIAPKSSFVWKK